MVIQFSIGNYRSFNSIQTINFRATGLVSEDKTVDENNIAEVDGQRLLKTIGVYGPNASGKSNLIKGFNFFREMIVNSLGNQYIFGGNAFKQSSQPEANFGFFQVVLLLDDNKYRYGFVLGQEEIAAEWLFGPAEKNDTFYFTRKGKEININKEKFPEGLNIPYETKLRPNALFLSFCSSYNGNISNKISDFFVKKVSTLHLEPDGQYTFNNAITNALVVEGKKGLVLKWLTKAGLYFNDIIVENMGEKEYSDRFGGIYYDFNEGEIKLIKNVYDAQGKVVGNVIMDFGYESDGTKKFYSFIGKIYDKFENGGLLISDEIDSNFHPALLQKIISLFNNPSVNKANAQLLFTSHDTNLMSPKIMRRDQFYFTEKSATDETILYSLSDLKGIRNNADFARQYLAGYYGALPVLGNYLEEAQSIENPEK